MIIWIDELHHVAEAQHGVVRRSQATALAPTPAAARHELGQGRWAQSANGIFRLVGAPQTDDQALMADVLRAGPGASISHRSAAAMWGVPGEKHLPTHVSRPRHSSGKRLSGLIVHEARRLNADQVTTLRGLPLVRPERVPFDLANIGVRAERVERVVDRLWSDRLVSGRSLRRVLESLPRRGFRGTALLRNILSDRGDDWVPPASGLESRAMSLLEYNGFMRFERQVDLGADEWVGRVDFIDRSAKVVIEVQSDRHHAALSSRRDDSERFARLEASGFTVVAVWEDELWYRPTGFLARLKTATGARK